MERIKKLKEYWWLITTIVAILTTLLTMYLNYLKQNEEMLNTMKTTQQMALKSVIWNEEIPDNERVSACDIYLSAGYNSLTKKHCEILVNESVISDAFFNESEVRKWK